MSPPSCSAGCLLLHFSSIPSIQQKGHAQCLPLFLNWLFSLLVPRLKLWLRQPRYWSSKVLFTRLDLSKAHDIKSTVGGLLFFTTCSFYILHKFVYGLECEKILPFHQQICYSIYHPFSACIYSTRFHYTIYITQLNSNDCVFRVQIKATCVF